MENRFQTLQVIYELVKNDNMPSKSNIRPNEIISRQRLPWDQIVDHLNALNNEEYIIMNQSSPAVITITDKGFQHIVSLQIIKTD